MAESVLVLCSLLLLVSSACALSDNPAAHFIYVGCSLEKYSPNTSYTQNLDYLMTSINESAAYRPYNKFNVSSSKPQGTLSALYTCRGDISMPDCTDCVLEAVGDLQTLCKQYYQGIIHMEGCSVKYDNTTFLHKQDTGLELRKCGPDVNLRTCSDDQKSPVDMALGGLLNKTGMSYSYRDSKYGSIKSMAQCMGDLSQSQCEDCLTEAIQVMRRECSTSAFPKAYGDIFLSKCYVRYTINQPYVPGKDCRSDSRTRKIKIAMVIVTGVLAGIALIIIIILMFRKMPSIKGNGKEIGLSVVTK